MEATEPTLTTPWQRRIEYYVLFQEMSSPCRLYLIIILAYLNLALADGYSAVVVIVGMTVCFRSTNLTSQLLGAAWQSGGKGSYHLPMNATLQLHIDTRCRGAKAS